MMFDSVREELQTKITSGRLMPRVETKAIPIPERVPDRASFQMAAGARLPIAPPPASITPAQVHIPPPVKVAPPPPRRHETSDLTAPKTSPTLVGFQNKNSTLPDWRIQLQNAVQQRKGGQTDAVSTTAAAGSTHYPTNGGAALKAEVVRRPEPVVTEPEISDPRVANAMRRINESRKAFLEPEKKAPLAKPTPAKAFKFDVVQTNNAPAPMPARINTLPKPRLVSAPPVALKRDTNKLPPIDLPQPFTDAPKPVEPIIESVAIESVPPEFAEIKRIRIRAEHQEIEQLNTFDNDHDEIEDLAHFSMRFGAGLFDLIIASFASMLILSPIAFTRGEWFTAAGLLTLGGVCAIVMFLYMTVCLGFFGKTMGMRLFSLELVDAVENEYPTLHQAAVSSSVFILSLLLGGAGFLTIFFNEEKRAAHDLLSGTILVREF